MLCSMQLRFLYIKRPIIQLRGDVKYNRLAVDRWQAPRAEPGPTGTNNWTQ
jgi:hypothetical protein